MGNSASQYSRRAFVGGVGLLTFWVAGCEKKLTPAEAKATNIALRALTESESRTLEALGEILLPRSAASGLAHYIDHQLSAPSAESMLILKYLGVSPPFASFYKSGLAGADAAARAAHGKSLAELDSQQGTALVTALSRGDLPGWSGPPAGLFYFTLRSDAIDVLYGTQEGFAHLGVPYMAHIPPADRWGE